MGGGWFPDDWHDDSGERFAGAVERARRHLPNLRQILSEPGKAMAQPSMALAMRLLEVQEIEEGATEAVVDGSIAELPMHAFQPHRILGRDPESGEWRPLGRGKTRLMGRLCMEHDVVAWNVELPEGVGAGDILLFRTGWRTKFVREKDAALSCSTCRATPRSAPPSGRR